MYLTCGCGHLMHTEGVDESPAGIEHETWMVRWECRSCGRRWAAVAPAEQAASVVDRLLWTDDARHLLDRLPPYLAPLVKDQAEDFAKLRGQRVLTTALLMQARQGAAITWDSDAERRLERIPAPVRAMARMELERAALDHGHATVTVSLMEEVKARYFGLFAPHQ